MRYPKPGDYTDKEKDPGIRTKDENRQDRNHLERAHQGNIGGSLHSSAHLLFLILEVR